MAAECGSILPTNSRASQWLLHRLLFLLQRRIFVSEILEIEGHHWSNVKSSLMSNPILEVQPLELSKNLLQTKNWLLKSTGASKLSFWLDLIKVKMIWVRLVKISDGWNYVRNSMFDRSKPKIECSRSITKRWTHSSLFDVRKNDGRVSSMNNLINQVKAFKVWYSISIRNKPKFRCSSSIINRWTCSSFFNVQKMMFNPSQVIFFGTDFNCTLIFPPKWLPNFH